MTTSVSDFCRNILHFTDSHLIQLFCGASTTQLLSKNEYIIKPGEMQNNIPFLVRGIVRGYILDNDGREISDCFTTQSGDALVGFHHLNNSSAKDNSVFEIPSDIGIITLTDCKIVSIPLFIMQKMLREYPEVTQLYIRLLEQSADLHRNVKKMLYLRNSRARYEWFAEKYPEIITLLNQKLILQKDIASYLNMSPQQLCKVLKDIRENIP